MTVWTYVFTALRLLITKARHLKSGRKQGSKHFYKRTWMQHVGSIMDHADSQVSRYTEPITHVAWDTMSYAWGAILRIPVFAPSIFILKLFWPLTYHSSNSLVTFAATSSSSLSSEDDMILWGNCPSSRWGCYCVKSCQNLVVFLRISFRFCRFYFAELLKADSVRYCTLKLLIPSYPYFESIY